MANAAAKNATNGAKDPKAAARDAKAQAKAAKKAEKARKKASNDPKDMGRIRQIIRAYQVTHEYDRALPYLLIGAFLLPIALGIVIGLLWGHAFNVIFAGVMIGILAAMFMLVRRAKAATYKRYAGKTGSAEVALGMLPKKWVSSPVIAANKSQCDSSSRARSRSMSGWRMESRSTP